MASGTVTVRSFYNHIHISGAAANYGYFVASGSTLNAHFDDVVAATGNSIAGTFNAVWSNADGTLTITGAGVYTGNGATSAGSVYFYEDSDNGTNTAQLIGPASTADVVLTLPATTGTVALIASTTPIAGTAANFAGSFTGANLYGGTYVVTTAGTVALPAVVVGMNFSVIVPTAIAVDFNPDATGTEDTISLNGVDETQGENIDNSSAAGALCVFQYYAADKWLAICDTNWDGE